MKEEGGEKWWRNDRKIGRKKGGYSKFYRRNVDEKEKSRKLRGGGRGDGEYEYGGWGFKNEKKKRDEDERLEKDVENIE